MIFFIKAIIANSFKISSFTFRNLSRQTYADFWRIIIAIPSKINIIPIAHNTIFIISDTVKESNALSELLETTAEDELLFVLVLVGAGESFEFPYVVLSLGKSISIPEAYTVEI